MQSKKDNHIKFIEKVKTVKQNLGKRMLTDEEMFLLTSEEIARTYTYEEKGYE